MKKSLVICIALFLCAGSALVQEPVDLDMINKIRDEGFNRSQVMESLRVLADEIGPRLTASPGMRAASKWSVDQSPSPSSKRPITTCCQPISTSTTGPVGSAEFTLRVTPPPERSLKTGSSRFMIWARPM